MENNTSESGIKTIMLLTGAVLVLLAGGMLTGMATAFIGSLIYIALLFPLLMGFAGGNTVRAAMKLSKVRQMNILIAASILMAALIYGTYHYGRYLALQFQMSIELADMTEAGTGDNLQAAKVFVDYALEQETGRSGFPGYMLFKAREGVSIGRFYSQNRLQFGSALTWLYWILELGIISWVVTGMARSQARKPFCDACGNLYARETHLGGTVPANEPLLLSFLQQRDFGGLGQLIERTADLPSTELYLQRCEACRGGSSHLTVRRAVRGPGGNLQLTDVSKITLPPRDAMLFLQQSRLEVN
jgi:hypothetical protein